MIFTSPLFVFGFLPIFLFCYWIVPRSLRNAVLLLFSLVFYAWGEPQFILWVFFSALFDWMLAGIIATSENTFIRRGAVALSIVGNVGMLAFFKYFNFFIDNLNTVDHWLGLPTWSFPHVILPLAISFIVFEKMTYVIDIYRRVTVPAESFYFYLLYVFFFPKMMAGPIIKYHDINNQLKARCESFDDLRWGLLRITRGIAKKVLIANALGLAVDPIFAAPPGQITAGLAWFGAFAFGFQLYFDFSGYSDIALGLARIMGIHLAENFNEPYLAASFTDFWRRWHISLTQWIREYLYISLGGNRRGLRRTLFNLWICFVISGLWHGANWTFICWGVFHGAMLTWERLIGLKLQEHLPRVLNVAITFMLVTFGWVLFRSPSISHAAGYGHAMFSPGRARLFVVDLNPHLVFIFACAWIICFIKLLPSFEIVGKRLQGSPLYPYGQTILWTLLLIAAVGGMSASEIKTFLYFRF